MHQCEEFRERITEYIIDRDDLSEEFHHELLICSSCSEFYAESREMMDALSVVDLNISERQWNAVEQRMRARILSEPLPLEKAGALPPRWVRVAGLSALFPKWAAATALVLITLGLARLETPVAFVQDPSRLAQPNAAPAAYVDQSVPLDPVTVDFLEESELLLRNVMKIEPSDTDDIADARKIASQQLAQIEQRKEAAADVPPVRDVIDTYETVLRDIRNVDQRNAAEDISDIRNRIRKNGLIANMKAFQPNVSLVSYGFK